ncbi:MAG: hypothetical protein AAB838_00620 [Patescibacteria group bacterium]
MTQIATITDQRQLTLPVALFYNNIFTAGEKVVVETLADGIKITSAVSMVRKLAGSVPIPARFKGLTMSELRERAIKEYFASGEE